MARYDQAGLNALEDCVAPLVGRVLKQDDGSTFTFGREWNGKQFLHKRLAVTGRERLPAPPDVDPRVGVQLVAGAASFEASREDWLQLLNLLRNYGWRGCGTVAPAHHPTPALWNGDYEGPIGQRVIARDARIMGIAAADARHDVPRIAVRPVGSTPAIRKAIEWFSGERRDLVFRFMRFCRWFGSFEIRPASGKQSR